MTRAYNTATTQQNTGGAVPAFIAGKNKIINGDFYVNQRNFTSTTTNSDYMFDRWKARTSSGTSTFTAQTFATGASPSGYEFKNYLQIDVTGQSGAGAFSFLEQQIEDARTLAGQTVTISFWAKASSGTPSIAAQLDQTPQDSPAVNITGQKFQLSTNWVRYSSTVNFPAIAGAINNTSGVVTVRLWVSAGSTFDVRTQTLGLQTGTFQIAGVQLESGSVATPFTTATGTVQGELAACQRYYQKSFNMATAPANATSDTLGQVTFARQATSGSVEPQVWVQLRVSMRTAPSVVLYNVYAGTAGQWSDGSTVGANARPFNIGENGFPIDNTDVTLSGANWTIHYVASAEL
jgi:hypothetical protein